MYTSCRHVYIGVVGVSDDRVMLSARVTEELKQLIDADSRTNQDVIESALWREFGGERLGVVERRIREKEKRLDVVQEEEEERVRERRELEKELEALRAKKETVENDEREHREQELRKLTQVPDEPDHPLVKEVADELGIEPEQALNEANEL